MPTCISYTPSQGYHFKKWKAKQALYDAAECNTPCRDNDDKLASGIYSKPDIPKQVTFQDSALLSGLQKINKKLKGLDNDTYALRAEINERSRREYKSPGRKNVRNRNRSRDNSTDSYDIL